jgi:AraC-like DNA-binding protein
MPELRETPDPVVRIQRLLEDVEAAFAIRVTIHDRSGILAHHRCSERFQRWVGHAHPYCEFGRRRPVFPGWNQNCVRDCLWGANRRAGMERRAFISCCWKGASEVVVPLCRGRDHIATLFAGVFRRAGPRPRGMPPEMAAERRALPVLSPARAACLANLLTVIGEGILAELDRLHEVDAEAGDRRAVIRRFIRNHARERTSLAGLAGELSLSPYRASHVVRELFGVSLQELVLKERTAQACRLLCDTELTLAHVAGQVGFSNRYFFSRQFRKAVGIPPGAYRERERRA